MVYSTSTNDRLLNLSVGFRSDEAGNEGEVSIISLLKHLSNNLHISIPDSNISTITTSIETLTGIPTSFITGNITRKLVILENKGVESINFIPYSGDQPPTTDNYLTLRAKGKFVSNDLAKLSFSAFGNGNLLIVEGF